MKRADPGRLSHQWFAASIGLLVALTALLFAHFTLNASPPTQASSFTFTTVGDYGASANTNLVLTGIANAGANFHLALGDLKYEELPTETDWCNYVKSYVGATYPFELGAGNHEMDGQGTQGHINNFALCLPDRLGGLTGVYTKQYYFDYQNLARIIYISPNLTLDGETYAYTVGSARYTWLVNAIDGARTANIPWVIVAMHKNCISVGAKSCEIGADVLNLLVNKKVDLILQGHEHNYQRSKQLAHSASCSALAPNAYNAACVADDGADNFYTKAAGPVLVVSGTGGRPIYASNPGDSEAGYFANYVAPTDTARYGFLKVTITSTQLSAQFVPVTAGTFTDAFTISSAPPPPTPTPSPTPNTSTLIAKNSAWKYLDNGSDQGTAWRANGFNDSAWVSGNGQLGYGDGDEATTISYGSDANNKYVTTYFRKTFNVANPASVSGLTLKLLRDDGAVVYLNGAQVASSNMPSPFAYNTFASSAIGGADESTYFTFNISPANLQRANGNAEALNGTNVLAVEIHQANATSSDVSFDAELTATNAPTATALASFRARAVDSTRVRVKWLTENELNVIGFNVWRRRGDNGAFEKINLALIPAQQIGQPVGARYRFVDRNVVSQKIYFYQLEILHADNSGEWSDVIKVKVP